MDASVERSPGRSLSHREARAVVLGVLLPVFMGSVDTTILASALPTIGRELGQGQLVGTILEYETGTLLLHGVGPSALLAVLVGDQGAIGKVRYYVRKAVPELVRAL